MSFTANRTMLDKLWHIPASACEFFFLFAPRRAMSLRRWPTRAPATAAAETEDMNRDQEEAYQAAGQRLKEARLAAGLSQEALSLDADLDQSTLSKIERVGPAVSSWRKLEAIADALHCVVEVNLRPKA